MSKRKVMKLLFWHIYRSYLLPLRLFLSSSKKSAIVSAELYCSQTQLSRCVLLCHYNANGILLDQIRFLASFFQEQGIHVIVVTTKVNEESINWIKFNLSGLVVRKNIGRDFGAWKDSIQWISMLGILEGLQELYLINDSVIFISNNLKDSKLQTGMIDNTEDDLIGLTESWQNSYHLQSYFLKFNRKALHSDTFSRFWKSYQLINSRTYSIEHGEIGLSKAFKNFEISCVYPMSDLISLDTLVGFASKMSKAFRASEGIIDSEMFNKIMNEYLTYDFTEINCTHRTWPLLVYSGCPLVKRDLLEKNPEGLFSLKFFFAIFNALEIYLPSFFQQSITNLSIPKKDSLSYLINRIINQ